MRFVFVAALLALGASAIPADGSTDGWGGGGGGGRPVCLNDTGADYLVKGYSYLLEFPQGPDFNATASALLSDKFTVWSDSILSLSQRPVS
jgi:hypothetical protein